MIAQMNLENIILSEIQSQSQKTTFYDSIHMKSRTGKSTEIESRWLVGRGWRVYGDWRVISNEEGIPSQDSENVLKLYNGDKCTTL